MKILYIATISNTVNAFLIPQIKMLVDQGHHVDVAFNIVQEVKPEIAEMGCRVHVLEFQRSPLNKDNYKAYIKLKEIVKTEKYDLVHTHTPVASACVRLACKKMKGVKIMYTAHGFHFYKGAPLKNWLIYYPIEKWLARYTDVLITINKEDYSRAKKSFKAGRVEYIPGIGLDTRKIRDVVVDKLAKRKELGVPKDAFVILSVGELNKNKNHEIIIRAVAKLSNPNLYYVICGQGPLENYLRNLASKLGIVKQVKLLGFHKDIAEICKVSDMFAFPSKREGLGLASLEAMSTGLPIVTSNVHGINDYSINGVSGFSCNPTSVDEFARAIKKLAGNSEMRKKMGKYNLGAVQRSDMKNVNSIMKNIYVNILYGGRQT